jgi:hypothetical protein
VQMLIVLFGSSSVMLSYWFNGMLNLSYATVSPCCQDAHLPGALCAPS